ncbi:MAG TPA: TadE/TadG family type IV pilus assembly protein [Gaiellaceae bacterium]|nr:TadE/TadG family type IV pilus assembly protein [Gaiellaceae bacterium]
MGARGIHIASERGQAAVEFALIAPVLIILVLGVIQIGIAFNHYLTITDAARAGARTAIVARFTGINSGDVQTAVQNAASSLDQSQLKVTADDPTDPTWTKAGTDIVVTVTYPYSINLLGLVVASGNLTSTMTEPLE